MKIFFALLLVVLSMVMAVVMYGGQPVYMAVFALSGVIIAAYVLLMARLTRHRLSMVSFLAVWGIVLVILTLGEGCFRAYGSSAGDGLLPVAYAAFEKWKNPYKLAAPVVASHPVPNPEPTAAPAASASIMGDSSARQDLTALIVAELCNNADLNTVQSIVVRRRLQLPAILGSGRDIRDSESALRTVSKSQAVLIDIANDQLRNYRYALDKGRSILSAQAGANASEAMQQFEAGQGQLIATAEVQNAKLVPMYQVVEGVMDLALKAKAQGLVPQKTREHWAELMMNFDSSHQEALENSYKAWAESYAGARKTLGGLVGAKLSYDPHQIGTFGHCTRLLPDYISEDEVGPYPYQILARWQSDAWLTEGRNQEAYRQ